MNDRRGRTTIAVGANSPCGTRARYVAGCRCEACRAANSQRYRDRRELLREASVDVTPTGPSLDGVLVRGGREVSVRRCPGANGSACVKGGAWLRGAVVCGACVERVTIWDGFVGIEPARLHLMKLRRAGVGYKAVAAACDVAPSKLCDILGRKVDRVRASTERRILAVDAGARADAALVSAARMNRLLAELRARGFTLRQTAALLGYESGGVLQIGARAKAHAATVAAVEKLWRRVEAGEVAPESPLVPAAEVYAQLRALVERGVEQRWLSERLGFTVNLAQPRERMFERNAVAARALLEEIERRRVEGDGLPDEWQAAPSGIDRGFGFDGGWSFSRPTSAKQRRKDEREEREELEQLASATAREQVA